MAQPPGNPRATPNDYRLLASTVPDHIQQSWNWQSRCSYDPSLWKRHMPRGLTFVQALEQRLRMVDLRPPLNLETVDLGAPRRPCEAAYVEKLEQLSADLIKECGSTDSRLFCLNDAFFKRSGFPLGDRRELDVMAPQEKRWERHQRQHTGFIVPVQQKESFCFSPHGLSETCVQMPEWFGAYEVHYGLHVETPPVVTYKGSYLMNNPQGPWWQTFLTEWSAFSSYELMYQARQGKLHFLSYALREAIWNVGSKTIMFGDEALASQLETLLYEVDNIRWSEVTPANRSLPEYAYDTPVSITGNWVPFNKTKWESEMSDNMYLTGDDDYTGYPRGVLTGLIDRKAEEMRTTRPARSGDETAVPIRYRLLEIEAPDGAMPAQGQQASNEAREPASDQMPRAKTQARCSRVLSILLKNAGATQLLERQGFEMPLPLCDAMNIIHQHVLQQGERQAGRTPALKEGEKPQVHSPVEDPNRFIPTIAEALTGRERRREPSRKLRWSQLVPLLPDRVNHPRNKRVGLRRAMRLRRQSLLPPGTSGSVSIPLSSATARAMSAALVVLRDDRMVRCHLDRPPTA